MVEDALEASPLKDDLLPPAELIIDNGIGVGDLGNVLGEFDSIGRTIIQKMVSEGLIKPDYKVLDIGCGLGRLARHLVGFLSEFGSYRGVDVTRSSVRWCESQYAELPNFEFFHADVLSTHYNSTGKISADDYVFPFVDEEFDFIWSTSLFTHMLPSGVDRYLSEIARVLKRGGSTWNTYMLLDEISEPLARSGPTPQVKLPFEIPGGLVSVPHDPEALTAVYADRIVEMHARHGLKILDIRFGPWSGRSAGLRAGYQDIIIATKATSPALTTRRRTRSTSRDARRACPVGGKKKTRSAGPDHHTPLIGTPDLTNDPILLKALASRVGEVIGQVVSLQSELLNALGLAEGVQARLTGFFCQPIPVRLRQEVEPYRQLAPGVHIGFEKGADVHLTVEPKIDHSVSPESCLNTILLSYAGGSKFLSLEAYCSWSDISGVQRYQLGVYAVPDRTVGCRAVLRLPKKDGGFVDQQFSNFEMHPDDRARNPSGPLSLPKDLEIDRERTPQLLIFFDTQNDLELRLDYINLYFA